MNEEVTLNILEITPTGNNQHLHQGGNLQQTYRKKRDWPTELSVDTKGVQIRVILTRTWKIEAEAIPSIFSI